VKAVILAGGYGTRISEESAVRPKPMVEIGEQPILWHLMKIFEAHEVTDFIVCCGYKGHMIKEYFHTYTLRAGDVTFDLGRGQVEFHRRKNEPWRVTLVDTGDKTMTGGRLKRVREYLDDETFFFTYGDSLSNVDLSGLLEFHKSQGTLATLTAVQPPGRFGSLVLDDAQSLISSFREKPDGDGGWVNGGFFVCEPGVIEYVDGDETSWEHEPLEKLARDKSLSGFRHRGYWQPMDTLRDKMVLEAEWASGQPAWKVW
jgi:glucose-1-phosphate cytidylyltransferase